MNEEEMVMPILKSCTLAAALALAIASTTLARQSKTITGDTKFVTATVEAIESSSREVTVKKPDGTYDVFYVPAGVKRFDTLKIGDTNKISFKMRTNEFKTAKRMKISFEIWRKG